jgi:molybdopterin molybdotransferase
MTLQSFFADKAGVELTKSKASEAQAGGLMPVEEARARILADLRPVGVENIPLPAAYGRTIAQDVVATINQPPAPVSAMDGYALRSSDAEKMPASLRKIGVSRAGARFTGRLEPGTCVRIFTGAVVPEGADFVALQEDAAESGDVVEIREIPNKGQYIRKAGLDFSVGSTLAASGNVLTARQIGLLAAAGHASVSVRKRPRIAVLSTGDELVAPGQPLGDDQIFASNGIALASVITGWGGTPIDLGIASDQSDVIAAAAERARDADMLVTTGGASVGDHDLVQDGLKQKGFVANFWRIAMRPGKPLMFGRLGSTRCIGLPGNPVASLVCSHLFLKPLLARLGGRQHVENVAGAVLGAAMPANDMRQDYVRAAIACTPSGLVATPFAIQDSSMLKTLADAGGLIIRAPFAPASAAGEACSVLLLS